MYETSGTNKKEHEMHAVIETNIEYSRGHKGQEECQRERQRGCRSSTTAITGSNRAIWPTTYHLTLKGDCGVMDLHLQFILILVLLICCCIAELPYVTGNALVYISHDTYHDGNHRRAHSLEFGEDIHKQFQTKHSKQTNRTFRDLILNVPKFKKLTISRNDLDMSYKRIYKWYTSSKHKTKQSAAENEKHWKNQRSATQKETSVEVFLNEPTIETKKIADKYNITTNSIVEYLMSFLRSTQYHVLRQLLAELRNLSIKLNNRPEKPIPFPHNQAKNETELGTKTMPEDGARSLASGRLLFLNGLKKLLWPLFMGLQILKSLLIAMFIPAIIGSLGKLLNRGISSGSAPLFIRPIDGPTELDFQDNTINFEDDNKFSFNDATNNNQNNDPYAYHQAAATQIHGQYVQTPLNSFSGLTRLGLNERQHQLMQDSYFSALKNLGSASFKQSGSLATSSSSLFSPLSKSRPSSSVANVNTFHTFQKVPDSSLLLSNYDPFYSPLLSRLDSVFAQLKLNSSDENCREKVICLMYANPTKYAPYSNLVSAQLSRELNELRKPTSDNPDILRFFKYMRAAKDGQDGADCEETFNECPEFKDFENPAMVSTYNDINKLVEARRML